MTLGPFGSEDLLKPDVGGFAPSGSIHLGSPALGQSAFLLNPGGQDYVGKNSYDDTYQIDE